MTEKHGSREEMLQETSRLLGGAVAAVSAEAIEPRLAPFSARLDELCRTLEEHVRTIEDERRKSGVEVARHRRAAEEHADACRRGAERVEALLDSLHAVRDRTEEDLRAVTAALGELAARNEHAVERLDVAVDLLATWVREEHPALRSAVELQAAEAVSAAARFDEHLRSAERELGLLASRQDAALAAQAKDLRRVVDAQVARWRQAADERQRGTEELLGRVEALLERERQARAAQAEEHAAGLERLERAHRASRRLLGWAVASLGLTAAGLGAGAAAYFIF